MFPSLQWGVSPSADLILRQLSGLSPKLWASRWLMNLQAFVDESIDDAYFAMAGYVASPQHWAEFSREWEELLPSAVLSKRNRYQFKMNEMAASDERMARVPAFYRVIEKYAELAISVQFKMADIENALNRISVPGTTIDWAGWRNPYLFAFRALTDVINGRREKLSPILMGHEKIDFIFDERSEKNKVVWAWEQIRSKLPEERGSLYGKTPRFEDDEEFLPLQAADFWAWWMRKWRSEQDGVPIQHGSFPWQFDPMTPPKLYVSCGEEEIITYLTSTVGELLPKGKSFVILPPHIDGE